MWVQPLLRPLTPAILVLRRVRFVDSRTESLNHFSPFRLLATVLSNVLQTRRMWAIISATNLTNFLFADTFENPDEAKFVCTPNACRCKGKAIMYFSSAAGGDYFPFIGMDAEGWWMGFSAYSIGRERTKIGKDIRRLKFKKKKYLLHFISDPNCLRRYNFSKWSPKNFDQKRVIRKWEKEIHRTS